MPLAPAVPRRRRWQRKQKIKQPAGNKRKRKRSGRSSRSRGGKGAPEGEQLTYLQAMRELFHNLAASGYTRVLSLQRMHYSTPAATPAGALGVLALPPDPSFLSHYKASVDSC
eukprot:GHVT01034384.1.p2 GENE.GHVT01034384.1~~GHVT01034384.1.p2  ORF type:complete len:113 (-),score=19.31 GHVT01034384.1:446-784(-)